MQRRLLVVDDEEDILQLTRYNLTKDGFKVDCVMSGEEALIKATTDEPGMILLDIMLPGLDGLEVLRRLKQEPKTAQIPVIMLTAKGEDADIVAGLELGADDYIPKPFSPRVLIARIRAVLRRRKKEESSLPTDQVKIHDLVIDPKRFEIRVSNKPVEVTATEFAIINHLVRHPGWVFTRNQIIEAVKGKNYPVTERSVDVQVVGLRKKLGKAGDYIETVRGVGYRFKDIDE